MLNLGGPDSLRSVRPFLYNLFSDREIIRLGPSFMQKPLAFLISSLRSKKTEEFYRMIGGKSPIYGITLAQAKALEEALNLEIRNEKLEIKNNSSFSTPISHFPYKVFIAMRYWHPLIENVIPEICKNGVKRLIVLSLYPHYSVATTGSSLRRLNEVISKYPLEIFSIKSWHDHPLYIDALVEKIRNGIDVFNFPFPISHFPVENVHVLFSAHSLPVKFIEEGDPYVEQINGTIREVAKKTDIKWSLSYQSKTGPVKWLEPSTEQMLHDLAGRGIKNLLVVPISFVSDHIETLYEIDILYKNMAKTLGINLERTEPLNTSPLFISALSDIVFNAIKEAGWPE